MSPRVSTPRSAAEEAVRLELQRLHWGTVLEKSQRRDEARETLAEMFAPRAIERLREHYVAELLEVEEFEERVEAALRGDIWWDD